MNKLFTPALTMATAVSLLLLSTVTTATDGIKIIQDSAWARATPPGSKTTAIYLTLMNHSDADVDLLAAAANISDRVELHSHINNVGPMKMQQVSSITVPADGQSSLEPHGNHIMVFNLQDQLKPGTEVTVELTFNNGNTSTVTIPVLKESPMSGDDSMKHNDMQKDGEHMHMKKESDDTHQHDKAS